MNIRKKDPAWFGCLALAIFATAISLSLSVITGWQLGDSLLTKAMMAAFGVLAVMGAHLMPAICGPAARGARLIGLTLWLFCIAYAAFSHANFFLSAQQQSGAQRELAVLASPEAGKPKKELIDVLSDKVKVKTELAKIQSRCQDACLRLTPAKVKLETRLALLNAQESDARDWQTKLNQQHKRQEDARDNLVLVRLAGWANVTIATLELLLGFVFSLILEGMACLGWYLVFRSRDSHLTESITAEVTMPVAVTANVTSIGQVSQIPSSQPYDDQIEELAQLVKAGKIKLTVDGIRKYRRCAQGKAADLKRLVQARMEVECHV